MSNYIPMPRSGVVYDSRGRARTCAAVEDRVPGIWRARLDDALLPGRWAQPVEAFAAAMHALVAAVVSAEFEYRYDPEPNT